MSVAIPVAAILAAAQLAAKGFQNLQAGRKTREEKTYEESIASREEAATRPQAGVGADRLSKLWSPQEGEFAKYASDMYRGAATTASAGTSGVQQENIRRGLVAKTRARLGATSAAAAEQRAEATAASEQALAGRRDLADMALARKKMKLELQAEGTGISEEQAMQAGEQTGEMWMKWQADFAAKQAAKQADEAAIAAAAGA